MAAPQTLQELFQRLQASQLMTRKELEALLARMRAEPKGLPKDAATACQWLVEQSILTRFQTSQLLAGRTRGFFIGKYKVLDMLGAGAMGRVYLAEHTTMRRRSALKVLPQTHSANKSLVERFYREARAVAALNHPNIVHAYDIDQHEGYHYIVMEFVDGMNLQQFVMERGPIPWPYAAEFIRQAALGLQYAHTEAGVVHRDIKPGNLMIDRRGMIKVTDLGLALLFTEKETNPLTLAQNEQVLGTADYLSPEQATDSHNVDTRADIYSLGFTFYFLLSGQPPFPDTTIPQKLLFHQTREPQPITNLVAGLPNGLVRIIQKMTRKLPEERYHEFGEVAKELRPFAARWGTKPPIMASGEIDMNFAIDEQDLPVELQQSEERETAVNAADTTTLTRKSGVRTRPVEIGEVAMESATVDAANNRSGVHKSSSRISRGSASIRAQAPPPPPSETEPQEDDFEEEHEDEAKLPTGPRSTRVRPPRRPRSNVNNRNSSNAALFWIGISLMIVVGFGAVFTLIYVLKNGRNNVVTPTPPNEGQNRVKETQPIVIEKPKFNPHEVVITEILYNPNSHEYHSDDKRQTKAEFVEIFNTGAEPFQLGGCYLRNQSGQTQRIPDGAVIQPKEVVVLIPGEEGFTAEEFYKAWGSGFKVYALDYWGSGMKSLKNHNNDKDLEKVQLCSPNGDVIDAVYYGSIRPWPQNVNGASIHLIPGRIDSISNDDGEFWEASEVGQRGAYSSGTTTTKTSPISGIDQSEIGSPGYVPLSDGGNQVGTLPFRKNNAGVIEVLLTTNTGKSNWLVPKGDLDVGITRDQVAQQKAVEEAGVEGKILRNQPIGYFPHTKEGRPIVISLFVLEVTKELETWTDQKIREREWVPLDKLAQRITNKEFLNLVEKLPQWLEQAGDNPTS